MGKAIIILPAFFTGCASATSPLLTPSYVRDGQEAAHILFFWLCIYAAAPLFFMTVQAFREGKNVR